MDVFGVAVFAVAGCEDVVGAVLAVEDGFGGVDDFGDGSVVGGVCESFEHVVEFWVCDGGGHVSVLPELGVGFWVGGGFFGADLVVGY